MHSPISMLHSQEAVRRGSLNVFHAGWNAHADSSVHAAMSYLCDCKKRGIRALSWKRARNCHAAAGRLQAKTSIHFALMVRTWTANKNSCFALGVFVDSHMDSSRSRAQLQQQKKLVTGTSWLISEHNCIIWKVLQIRLNPG